MGTILNDAFTRTGGIGGSTASPAGGAWSDIISAHNAGGVFSTNGSVLVATGSSGETIASLKNAVVATTIQATATVPFTPTTDGWIAGAILHADSDGYPCWIGWASGGTRRLCRFDTSSDDINSHVLADHTDTSIASSDRTAHTIELRAASNGDLTLWVDGAQVTGGGFASTVNDATLTTAGRPGLFARGVNIDNVTATDAAVAAPVITGPSGAFGLTSTLLKQGRLTA